MNSLYIESRLPTTTGYGAWGLPEEIRENWGPGTHLTTACRPFLQGAGLRGIDSWPWHSDKVFSLPRQWTFSIQKPFFLDMRLSLKGRRWSSKWNSAQLVGIPRWPTKWHCYFVRRNRGGTALMWSSQSMTYLVEGSATLVSHIFLKRNKERKWSNQECVSTVVTHTLHPVRWPQWPHVGLT